MLTPFELTYWSLEPFLPAVHGLVRQELRRLTRGSRARPRLLDVGGRKSHVTIGVPADVTVSDLPRASSLQQQLHLGINDQIIRQTMRRRSNIREVVFDDMTRTDLPAESFDLVVAVEVLEHVEEDDLFVRNVARVLRRGGTFLMTTPNGDFVRNTNPDHKRHYRRAQLEDLLARHLSDVHVWYAVLGSRWRDRGLQSWSPRHPWRTLNSMAGNLVNRVESRPAALASQPNGPQHLFARARAPRS